MIDDPDRCYAALRARDPRFDGWFFVAVTTTGIYCRPSCPALTADRRNVRFHATAASAQAAGFRACKRCRPDAAPGSPAWDLRADLAGRAMRAIVDGVVDREGVAGLARRLGYSARHVHRELTAAVGAGPLALARAQRAQTARLLIETSELGFAEVAFAAGFGSVRQFNATVREVFASTPSQLRARAGRGGSAEPGALVLRLPLRQPASLGPAFAHLADRAVPGLEEPTDGGGHRRALALPHGPAIATLTPMTDHVRAVLRVADLRDLTAAVARCRRLLDLDADPAAVDAHLAADPRLAPLVAAHPGLRVPGATDPFEAAVRTVLGQQVSVASARGIAARIVARLGESLAAPWGGVVRAFPSPDVLATADLADVGLPGGRSRTVAALAAAVVDERLPLDVSADRSELRRALGALPGIGPWSAEVVALRALGDPDAFPATDLVLRRAAQARGIPAEARALLAAAEAWRPWRSYAAQHLWNTARTVPRRVAA